MLGSIPSAIWIAKIAKGKDFDIRDYGSKNAGLTNTFRQAGSSAGVAVLNAVFMAFVVITPVPELVPGFRHAFFVAAVLALGASALALGMRDRNKAE